LVLGTPDLVSAPRGDRQLVEKGGMLSSEDKAVAVHALLLEEHGHHEWRPHHDAVSELVRTILSQNTSDVNSDRAFARLQSRFATWEQLLLTDAEEIVEAIQPGGLAWIKAPRIQKALQAILKERGELSLDFLKDMDIREANAWLVSLEGVGPKTAACVLLFALGRPALPVDTHVLRVSRRLGLIGPRDSAEKAHIVLGDMLPDEAVYDFHVNMVTHGRQVCHAQRPRCDACCLAPLCDYLHRSR
jgi:endonuclease-3